MARGNQRASRGLSKAGSSESSEDLDGDEDSDTDSSEGIGRRGVGGRGRVQTKRIKTRGQAINRFRGKERLCCLTVSARGSSGP